MVLMAVATPALAVEPPAPGLYKCFRTGDARAGGMQVSHSLQIDGANYVYQSGDTQAQTVVYRGAYSFISDGPSKGRLSFSTGELAGREALWGPDVRGTSNSLFFQRAFCYPGRS